MAADSVRVQFSASIGALIRGVEDAKTAIESVRESTDRVTEGAKHLLEAFGLAFSVEKIGEFIEHMANLGLQTERTMAQLGTTAEETGVLGGIAKLTGTSMEGLTTSIERMTLNARKATQDALSPQAQAFRDLGISANQFIGLPTPEKFERLADAVSQFRPSLERTALVMQAGGRGVAQLIPLLAEGSKGFHLLDEEVKATGATLTDAQTKAFAETHKKLTLMGMSIEGVGNRIFTILKPAIDKAVEAITKWVQSLDSKTIETGFKALGNFVINLLETISTFFVQVTADLDRLGTKLGGFDWKRTVLNALDPNLGNMILGKQNIDKQLSDIDAILKARKDSIAATAKQMRDALSSMFSGAGGEGGEAGGKNAPAPSNAKDALGAAAAAIAAQIEMVKGEYAQFKLLRDADVASFKLTKLQEIDILRAHLGKMIGDEQYLLMKKRDLYPLHSKAWEEAEKARVKATEEATKEISKLDLDAVKERVKQWEGALKDIQSAWDSQLRGLLAGTTSWAQAMKSITADLVLAMIKKFEELAVVNPLVSALSSFTPPAEFFSGILKMIMASVGQVFSGVSAFLAPVLGPAAPAAAAGVAAGVEATAVGMASAAGGWLSVPSDNMVTMLHAQEMVLPAGPAQALRELLAGGGGSGGGGHTFNFNVTSPDQRGVRDFFFGNKSALADVFRAIMRDNPSLRPA